MSTAGASMPSYHPGNYPSHVRSTDAQREIVAGLVRGAAEDGRIDLVELDERLGLVYAAKTHGDLTEIIADIVPPQSVPQRPPAAPVQPMYVYPAPVPAGVSPRIIMPGFLLCLFLGVFGAHRFYVGKSGSGVAMILCTLFTLGIVSGIWMIVDLIVLATGSFRDREGRLLRNWT